MTLMPEDDIATVRAWCTDRVPAHARKQVLVECEVTDRHVTIVERRLPYQADRPDSNATVPASEWTRLPIARLRYVRTRAEWTVYWRDRHQRFHRHIHIPPTVAVTDLLEVLDRNPGGIFWG
ncbi:MAG: DUF3024 domain-containing protein [Pseudonocardia sp.]|nr:DUF3024 domain-containing protein [Pseudonocardia sp.]